MIPIFFVAVLIWVLLRRKSVPKPVSDEDLQWAIREADRQIAANREKRHKEAMDALSDYVTYNNINGKPQMVSKIEIEQMKKEAYGMLMKEHKVMIELFVKLRNSGQITEEEFEDAINPSLDEMDRVPKKYR